MDFERFGDFYMAFLGIMFASINVVGGYWVTERMLGSFKSKKREK